MSGLSAEGGGGRVIPFGAGRRASSSSAGTASATIARLEKARIYAELVAADARLATMRENFEEERGFRRHGAVVTRPQKLLALGGYLLHNAEGEIRTHADVKSEHQRLEVARALSGLAINTIKVIVAEFEASGSVTVEEGGTRGPPKRDWEELVALEPRLKKWVDEQLNDTSQCLWVTRQSIQAFIEVETGLHVSYARISQLADVWGLKYVTLQKAPVASTTERKIWRRLVVCQERLHMIRGGRGGSMDESYCNKRAAWQKSFANVGSLWSRWALGNEGLGDRLCFIHGVEPRGLMGGEAPMGDLVTLMPTLHAVFKAGKGGGVGDYHGNFTGPIFMTWAEVRLLPWFQHEFPNWATAGTGAEWRAGRGFTLSLDNAPYHVTLTPCLVPGPGFRFDPRQLSKKELFEAMVVLGCASLTVPNHTFYKVVAGVKTLQPKVSIAVQLDDASKGLRAKAGVVPYLPELGVAALDWIIERTGQFPQVLMNDFEYFCYTKTNGNLVPEWNAANWPRRSPIEYVWGGAKAYAAAAFSKARTMVELNKHINEGLYTHQLARPGILEVKGGNYAGVGGACAATAALFRHCLYEDDGGFASQIKQDPILRACGPLGDKGVATMDDLIVPEDMRVLASERIRLIIKYRTAKMAAVEANIDVGEALQAQDEGDEEGDDED